MSVFSENLEAITQVNEEIIYIEPWKWTNHLYIIMTKDEEGELSKTEDLTKDDLITLLLEEGYVQKWLETSVTSFTEIFAGFGGKEINEIKVDDLVMFWGDSPADMKGRLVRINRIDPSDPVRPYRLQCNFTYFRWWAKAEDVEKVMFKWEVD